MKTLVIFIHGLGGSEKTWEQFLALAREDTDLKEHFTFEPFTYDTNVFGFGASMTDVAALLRSDLSSKYRDYGEVVLISHSQGGLIAEKYLVEEVKGGQHLRVVLLMTYAMPRAGSLLARFAPGTQTKQLRTDSDFMRYLNSDWETLEMSKRLRLVRVDGTDDAVISRPGLAEFDNRNVAKVRGGHTKSVRPDSRETDSYILFKQALQELRPVAQPVEIAHSTAHKDGPEPKREPKQEPAAASAPKLVPEKDSRRSLMILPFEDLSPTHDNDWFADGIAAELISALSPIKALRVADQEATKNYKRYDGNLPNYAKEMGMRYFVQGSVRKFGDQIKIAVTLLDIETGDHLWQDSLKGTMDDIFDIQETVATKVVEGLKVIIAPAEKKKLSEHGTENAEAYELYLQANQYFARQTKEGFQLAMQLYSEAIRLDPDFAEAYQGKGNAIASLCLVYGRDPALSAEGLKLLREALRIRPDLWSAYYPLALIFLLQGDLDAAERTAKDYVQNAPKIFASYSALGIIYMQSGQPGKAIGPFEEALALKPEQLVTLWNVVVCASEVKEFDKREHWAGVALPYWEKHLKLFPENEVYRVIFAMLLLYAGRHDAAREAAKKLTDLRDGSSIYTTACLHVKLSEFEEGIRTLRKAILAGYRNIRDIEEFLSSEEEGIVNLRGTPEYEDVRAMVERIEAEQGTAKESVAA